MSLGSTEELHASVVVLPCACAFLGGLALPKPRIASLLLVAGFLIAARFAWNGPGETTHNRVPSLLGTALLWMTLGFVIGVQIRAFIARFGPLGYFYTLAVTLVGIGFAELLVQGVIPLARGDRSEAVDIAIWGYGFVFAAGAGLLLQLRHGRSAWRKVVAVFTIVGGIEFVLDQLSGAFLYSIAWFVPGVDSPKALQLEFTLLMGTLAAFWVGRVPSKPARAIELEPSAGLVAAVVREEGPSADAPPLTAVPVEYDVPTGWSVDEIQRSDWQHTVVLRPDNATPHLPGRLGRALARMMAPRLYLSVMEYTLDEVAGEERLRRTTEENIAARNATVLNDRVGTRHGVVSYECECSTPRGYAYVVTFVVRHSELVCYWECADPSVFRSYLRAVDEFVDSLEFTGAGGCDGAR